MTEDELLRKVQALAKRRGWLSYHTHDSRRSDPGFPDLVLVRKDRLIFAELKSAKGRPTPEQSTWLISLGNTGAAEVWLWTPASWDDGTILSVLD